MTHLRKPEGLSCFREGQQGSITWAQEEWLAKQGKLDIYAGRGE